MNKMEIFKSNEFGQVRTVVIDNEPWFVGKDVAECLGYSNTSDAISKHVDSEDKRVAKCDVPQKKGKSSYAVDTTIINESGLYSLIMSSKLPTAKQFKRWVTSEVLPALRKTGSYTVKAVTSNDKQKRAEAMLINARTRNAKLLADLAEKTNIGTYKNVLVAKAANVAVNEPLLELPPSGRPHHNLKYFCKMFGKKETWNFQLGKILCKEKVEKVDSVTGVWVEDKAEHNNSQRQNFEWYDDYLIPVLKKILHKEDN